MKKLSREAFNQAREFLKTQARPLDRALFEVRFEGASVEHVVDELAAFQNKDGGFGHALEPDLRTPTSSALISGSWISFSWSTRNRFTPRIATGSSSVDRRQ